MTNYRIGPHCTTSTHIAPDYDHIDLQKGDRVMKLQFQVQVLCEHWADDSLPENCRSPQISLISGLDDRRSM